MAGVYDFDKTILGAYDQGHSRGVDMVNMAEKRKQFQALQDLRQSAFDLQKDAYDKGLLAQEQFADAYNAFQKSRQEQKDYNKRVEKERSRVENLSFFDKDFWRWDTFLTQTEDLMGWKAPTTEEIYKDRMARQGTPELGIAPEPWKPVVTPEMAGQLQLLQLLFRNERGQVRNDSIMDLIYKSYELDY
jgi:hypothetical protein